jgi:O-antigen biosynthesis protein
MLEKCLDAVYREAESIPLNIVLVDNNSPAEEYRVNSELFSKRENSNIGKLSVMHYTQDTGFAVASNAGAKIGNAPYVMFLNDDVELQPGAISKIVADMTDNTVGIVGIKLLFPPTSTSPIRPAGKIQHVGMALNIRGEPTHPLVGWSPDHRYVRSRNCIAVTGACLTIRRVLFNQVGGFDPVYGLGTYEDVDLCMKVIQNGQRVWADMDALGYHYVGSTAEKKKVQFPMMQNRMIFQTKWSGSGVMQWTDYEFLDDKE